jgi:CHRD domain
MPPLITRMCSVSGLRTGSTGATTLEEWKEIMQSRAAVRSALLALSAVALVLAGCGTVTKTVEVNPPHVSNYVPPPAPRSVTYTFPLTSDQAGSVVAPHGQPGASGTAVFSVNPRTGELCWTFSNLTHITNPTVARVYRYTSPRAPVQYGFKLGAHFKPSGCVPENLIFLGLLGATPQEFWVSIHSARYPEGAARGRV